MLPLSSPPCGHQRRASVLLLLAAALLCVGVSASLPAHNWCPPPLTCVQQRRHHCQPGSSHCGPCLSPFQENQEGRCVQRRRHQNGKVTTFTDLDEEIDFLHSVIEKQQVSQIKTTKNHPKQPASISFQSDNENKISKQISQNRLLTTAAPGSVHPNTSTPQARITGADGRAGPVAVPNPRNDRIILIMISLCAVVGTVALILAAVCYVKSQQDSRLAEKVDYPAFKGPSAPAAAANGTSMGDKTLAQSAQMYHYQHQKQQMLSMENNKPEQKVVDSEVTSDEEEVGGGFTVYECPGLAPTGEMEVKNPLFDDSTLDYQGNHK
ncbi:neural proliferation differentiation and control protein 1a [Nematolebias whitei]|uniref:neural proliferation differentiation and control protein 1a n=1 Tax=Nematolebias whitei TaxID=451745 RepID=UPI001896BACE|nr:neural proliferation differentiation and control protein 1a [Nematolebias whitei]